MSTGIFRLNDKLLVVLDVARLLDFGDHLPRRMTCGGLLAAVVVPAGCRSWTPAGTSRPRPFEDTIVMKTCLVVDDSRVVRKVARKDP